MRSRRPWLYLAVCAFGLPLYLLAFHYQAHQGTLAARDLPLGFTLPVRLSIVAEAPGTAGARSAGAAIEAATGAELQVLAEGRQAGTPIVLTSSEGRTVALKLPRNLSLAGIVVTLVSGLFFWAVSAFVFAPRARSSPVAPGGTRVADFFWCTFLYGLAIMTGGVSVPPAGRWPVALLSLLQVACLAALPVIFLHLSLTFPRRRPVLDRWPGLFPALTLVAALLVVWQAVPLVRYAHSPAPALFRAMDVPSKAADGVLVAQVLSGLLILAGGARRCDLARERAQIKWLLWGFALGVTPYVFLRTLPQLIGVRAPFGPSFDRLLEMAIPIAFVFAVVRFRFLDIDIIIRRSIIYAVLALLMVGVYFGLGILIGQYVDQEFPARSLLLALAIGAGGGLMFQPLRRSIARGVDRTLFKLSHDYGEALAMLSGRLAGVHGQAELARVLDEFLAETLGVRAHAVLLKEKGEWSSFGNLPPATIACIDGEITRTGAAPFPAELLATPGSTSMPEIEVPSFPACLAGVGLVLVQPLLGSEALIALGSKQSERRYVEPDLALIRGAAEEAGRALERIRLIQAADTEARARRQAEEMDRLKSDFLSRVAHDLRTPLASIAWSTDNLLDGIVGPLIPAQQEYLHSVKASAGHLSRLVDNLLEISRLEQGRAHLDLAPVRLSEIVEQALLTIRPLAAQKRIAIRLACEEDHPARGNAEKLVEVVLNLLDNAIRFSPAGQTVEIRIARGDLRVPSLTAAGRAAAREPADGNARTAPALVVSIRDHGPGLGGADPQALFERFRQGAHSPHAPQQGFGLGLYIVKSYVALMRGEVAANDAVDGGALFSITLPCADGVSGGAGAEDLAAMPGRPAAAGARHAGPAGERREGVDP